ncbi:MAG: hypothetical protein AAF901_13765, partial [Bacteroidota bacterium]
MKIRWYISFFVITVALLGIVSQQQVTPPNQELVLEFSDSEISSHDVEKAVTSLKAQLVAVGAENIIVSQEDGQLKL